MTSTPRLSVRRIRLLAVMQAALIITALGVPATSFAALTAVVPGTQAPNPIAPGGTATYNVQVTNASGSSARSVAITSIGGLPAGASLASSQCLSIAGDGNPHTIVVTISTTGATPAGTHAITMTASRYTTGCSGGSSGTVGSGSLVVAAAAVSTTTTITSDTPDPTFVGGAYTVGVSVTRASGSATITGTVTVSDGTDNCTDTTPTGGAAATVTYSCSITSSTAGIKTLTASYPGNASLLSSSDTAAHTVNSTDGTGTMTVTPYSSPVQVGASQEYLDFAFTAGAALGAGSQLTIVIPAGWTTPTTTAGSGGGGDWGALSVTSRSCSGVATGTGNIASVTGSGPWTITLNIQCSAGQNFNLRYGNGAGYTVVSSTAGSHEFTTETKGSGGTLTGIASQPTLNVNAAAQTITFPALAGVRLDQAAPVPAATASSGLAVTYSTASAACSVTGGGVITLLHAGTCAIDANQAGNATYAAAPQVSRSFTVAKGNQTITFGALADQTLLDSPVTIGATASSGLAVSFGSNSGSVCTVAGTSVTLLTTGTCSITASQAGDADWNAASPTVTQTFDVALAASTTTVTCPASVVYDGTAQEPCTVTVTGSGGLSLTPTAVYAANTDAGTATASYSYPGDATHGASADSTTFDITKADPVCAVSGYSGTYDGSAHGASGSCTGVLAETLSGLSLGSSFTNVPGGTANWAFTDVTGNYTDDSGSVGITITKADTTTTVTCPAGVVYDGTPQTPCSATVTGPGLSTSIAVSYLDNTDAGTATASASYAGGSNHNASSDSTTFDIAQADQVIDFPALPNVNEGSSSFVLAATSDSGLPISYTSPTPDVCTVSGTTVTIVGPGTCTIVAAQAGDANHAPASVTRSFTVRAVDSTTPETSAIAPATAPDGGSIPPGLLMILLAAGVFATGLVVLGLRARRDAADGTWGDE